MATATATRVQPADQTAVTAVIATPRTPSLSQWPPVIQASSRPHAVLDSPYTSTRGPNGLCPRRWVLSRRRARLVDCSVALGRHLPPTAGSVADRETGAL